MRRALLRAAAQAGEARHAASAAEWAKLAQQGAEVNPCRSRLHPAVVAGTAPLPSVHEGKSVQQAYDPNGQCFACGAPGLAGGRGTTAERGARSEAAAVATLPIKVLTRRLPGPAHVGGLCMQSFRTEEGLQTSVSVPEKYQVRRRGAHGARGC